MKKNFMCFIYVYFWNRKMDNPVQLIRYLILFPTLMRQSRELQKERYDNLHSH